MKKLNVIRKGPKVVKRKRRTSYVKEKMKSGDLLRTMGAIMDATLYTIKAILRLTEKS